MKIEIIKVNELNAFVHSDLFQTFSDIPITHLRAISQSNNPRATDDDVALIFAHDDGVLCSYIGLLPDLLFTNTTQKIWWNSCWWANETRNNNASMQLFYLACKITGGRFYFPELTPHTSILIKQLKGFETANHKGIRAYLHLNSFEILKNKFPFFYKIKPLLRLMDACIRLLYLPIFTLWEKKLNTVESSYQFVNQIDAETSYFIEHHNTNELFRRNKKELEWIMNFPWITEDKPTASIPTYAFSLNAKSFKNRMIRVKKEDQIIGFFILLVKDGNAKLTYCFFEENHISTVINVMYKVLLDLNVFTFITFHPLISEYMKKNKHPFIFLRNQIKTVGFPIGLKQKLLPNSLQDGDGDCGFV